MAAADHIQQKLFNMPKDPPVPVKALPIHSHEADAVQWHAAEEDFIPTADRGASVADEDFRTGDGMGHPLGFHTGTLRAAVERDNHTFHAAGFVRNFIPVNVTGSAAINPEKRAQRVTPVDSRGQIPDSHLWDDEQANDWLDATRAVRSGQNVHYINTAEDSGSISTRSPRQNVKTWSEQVMADPSKASYWERKAVNRGAEIIYKPARLLDRKWSGPVGFEGTNIEPPASFAEFSGRDGYTPTDATDPDISDANELYVPHLVYPHRAEPKKEAEKYVVQDRLPGFD